MSLGPPEDRRPTLTPALAVRVGIAGSVLLALFAIVFFRLWFLQVLTGDHYVLTASRNHTRVVAVAPERGEILASDGQPLVTSTTALALQIDPTGLPVKVNQTNLLDNYRRDDVVYDRVARLAGVGTRRKPCQVAVPPPNCDVASGHCAHSTTRPLSPIACDVAQQIALNTYADVTIREPVSSAVQYYVAERGNSYRGVDVVQTSVPGYPFGGLAAQTLGAVGRLTTAEQKLTEFSHVNANAVVGQSGLEYQYDQYLRGKFGKQRVNVNAQGIAVGQGREQKPVAGENLKTTINLKVQQVGQSALQHAIDANHGFGGAFVAIDPQSGAIYGMGSLPTYNPKIFTEKISQAESDQLFGQSSTAPLLNRAYQSVGPDGSTFKVITATAAMQSGKWTPDAIFDDDRDLCFGTYCPQNSGGAHYGPLDLTSAIKVSDDEFFYNLGALLNVNTPSGGPLQKWEKLFGIGENPHVDLPSASLGTQPTPAWFDRQSVLEKQCETATGAFRYTNGRGGISSRAKRGYHRSPTHPPSAANPSPCGLGTDGDTWTIGQNVLSAVGQGDVQVSPLQLALVYSAIENGGTIVRPHVGDAVQNADGTVLDKLSFPAQRHLDIDPSALDAIRTGLLEAAKGGGPESIGTSQDVMGNFPMPVYGKTGTAQYIPTSGPDTGVETDYAWYSCYVPASATSKPIEIVVWDEGGGFGDIGSAPVARQILSQWFYGKPGPWIEGQSQDQ